MNTQNPNYLKKIKNKFPDKTIVLCHGVFDILHVGHIEYLQDAKRYGDILVVSITSNEHVNKGPGRPIFTLEQRMKAINALKEVDFVVPSYNTSAVEVLLELKPSVYFKGKDYQHIYDDEKLNQEKAAIESYGGKIEFATTNLYSSTNIVNQNKYSYKTIQYLESFKRKYSVNQILSYIDKLKGLNINLIGETIIDKYIFGNSIGKSSKYPSLILHETNSLCHPGGIETIQYFLAELDIRINLFSQTHDIIKTRYIDNYYQTRLLELYQGNILNIDYNERERIFKIMNPDIPTFIIDYGHGLINANYADIFSSSCKNLYLNVQCNGGNYGYNLVTKYSQSKLIVVDRTEAQLALNAQNTTINKLALDLSNYKNFTNVIITDGSNGSVGYNPLNKQLITCPALATKVVDTIGGGDKLFAIASVLSCVGTPIEICNFVGNLAASIEVETTGHAKHTKAQFKQEIKNILS